MRRASAERMMDEEMKRMTIRLEEPKDYREVENLTRGGFLQGVTGIHKDPEGYFADEAAVDAFDAAFPPKEKKKLPGQLV